MGPCFPWGIRDEFSTAGVKQTTKTNGCSSTSVQVMCWWQCSTKSYYQNQCWLQSLISSMYLTMPRKHVPRQQWVNKNKDWLLTVCEHMQAIQQDWLGLLELHGVLGYWQLRIPQFINWNLLPLNRMWFRVAFWDSSGCFLSRWLYYWTRIPLRSLYVSTLHM